MSVFRVHKTRDYTVLSNYHLKDADLSLRAKGLMSVMLSLPDDWDYSISGLAAICKEGKQAVKTTLDELKEHGYLVVTKCLPSGENNRLHYRYDVFEVPNLAKPQVSQGCTSQGLDGQWLVGQGVVTQPQLSTYKSSTDKVNTKDKNILSENPKSHAADERVKEVIDYLNAVTGSRYSTRNKQVCGYINARLRDGFSVGDFRQVIDVKSSQWLNTEMAKYLRPSTLFAPSHFVEYLNEVPSNPLGGYNLNAYELEEWAPSK